MSNLNELLGTAYHEGMTVEEINTALSSRNFVSSDEAERLRATASKTSQEISSYKKQNKALKDKLDGYSTEEERKAREIQEQIDSLQAQLETSQTENATLKKNAQKAEYVKQFSLLGYDEKLANGCADAVQNGDMGKFFELQKQHNSAIETKVKEDVLNSTPKPQGGSSTQNYDTLIQNAADNGDTLEALRLMRESQN